MNYVEGKGPLPNELELAFYARDFHALPEAGGVYDQPAGMVRRMKNALDVYNLWREWKTLDAERKGDWIKAHPGRWSAVNQILEIRNATD